MASDRKSDEELISRVVPWTADLALRVAGVSPDDARDVAVAKIRDAVDNDDLPEDAVDALIAAGWTELED